MYFCRHLVLNKDVQGGTNSQTAKTSNSGAAAKASDKKKQDKIRYQYDEHYFLTDPDEFIQEFWAQDPDWQVRITPALKCTCTVISRAITPVKASVSIEQVLVLHRAFAGQITVLVHG